MSPERADPTWQRDGAGFARLRGGLVLLGILGTLSTFVALASPDPLAIALDHRLEPPALAHGLGTDPFGRDVLSRVAHAQLTSLELGALVASGVLILALPLGSLAGYRRGSLFDRILGAITGAFIAFPDILIALALLLLLGAGRGALVLALIAAYTPGVLRTARAVAAGLGPRDFVTAATISGRSTVGVWCVHILPNTLPALLSLVANVFAWSIVAEGALGFIGVGIPEPAPTLGNMLYAARSYLDIAPWLAIAPGVLLALTLIGVTLISDGLRDRLDRQGAR